MNEDQAQLVKKIPSKDEVIGYLASENEERHNLSKLAEELAELLEIILKRINKIEKYKPSLDKITEEVGDVEVRIAILKRMYGLEDDVASRISYKLGKLAGYVGEGLYGTKV